MTRCGLCCGKENACREKWICAYRFWIGFWNHETMGFGGQESGLSAEIHTARKIHDGKVILSIGSSTHAGMG